MRKMTLGCYEGLRYTNDGMFDADLFEKIENAKSVDELKCLLKVVFLDAIIKEHSVSNDRNTVYKLAGLLGIEKVRQLQRNDPYIQILDLAMQLELPRRHQDTDSSWRRLEEKVKSL